MNKNINLNAQYTNFASFLKTPQNYVGVALLGDPHIKIKGENKMEKQEGKKISLTTYILSLIIMALICGFMVYIIWTGAIGNKNSEQEVTVAKTEKLTTEDPKIEKNEKEEEVTETEKTQIEEYIAKIYPIPSATYSVVLEEFNSIKNANQEWIWSTAIKNCETSSVKEPAGNVSEINKSARKLYGTGVGNFPEDDYENLSIIKENDVYYWLGANASIPNSGQYRITNINKENGLYKVEVAQCILYYWEHVEIMDIKRNTLKVIVNENDLENISFDVDKAIEEYIDNNIDKLAKVELTIEYDKDNIEYHVISIKNK